VEITANASVTGGEGRALDLSDERQMHTRAFLKSVRKGQEQVPSERVGSELSCALPAEAAFVMLSSRKLLLM